MILAHLAAAALSQQVNQSNLLKTGSKRALDTSMDTEEEITVVDTKRHVAESTSSQTASERLSTNQIPSVLSKPIDGSPSSSSAPTADDMAAKMRELEAKYESLKNNSLKLAEAVIKGETAPDEAKHIIDSFEKK